MVLSTVSDTQCVPACCGYYSFITVSIRQVYKHDVDLNDKEMVCLGHRQLPSCSQLPMIFALLQFFPGLCTYVEQSNQKGLPKGQAFPVGSCSPEQIRLGSVESDCHLTHKACPAESTAWLIYGKENPFQLPSSNSSSIIYMIQGHLHHPLSNLTKHLVI